MKSALEYNKMYRRAKGSPEEKKKKDTILPCPKNLHS